MADFEQFVERLDEALNEDYASFHKLQQGMRAVCRRTDAVSKEFPAMLYFRGRRDEWRTVFSAEEEGQAAEQGYQRTPLPLPEPKYFVERPRSQGGTSYDLRRVTLATAAQEAQFFACVEPNAWIPDDVSNPHGARGIGLDVIVQERAALLKAGIDQELAATATEHPAPTETAQEKEITHE